ncbi:MAG TPA: MobA/MobL family protein [Steroidobacteraceae bacterium]|jgi:hypothetical protein|nr:MobA/MobL family protein [Steroidobacteraceae bacterium]
MAVYFLRSRHISRGKGARVTRAAAYRAGERILDERTSEVYNYTHRDDVVYKDIVIPADLASHPEMAWTQDRSTLWNAAEHAGKRRNSRLAREWLVLIPPELSPEQRARLVRRFATELAEQYRCAVDLAIHRPRHGADPRNQHAHLLMTTREVTPQGLGRRVTLEVSGPERYQRGMTIDSRTEYLGLRARWATLTNEALREAGIEQRIDHRSLAAQGINRDPTTTIPEKVFYAERKRGPSTAGDAIRARALQRAEARRRGPEDLARVLAEQRTALKQQARQNFARRDSATRQPRWSQLTRDERNAQRRQQYQARRALEKQDPALEQRHRDAARRSYLAEKAKHPEVLRERTNRYRADHRDAVNANQRDYRRKRRELQQSKSAGAGQSPSAEQSLRNWNAYRQQHGTGPTAEESLRNWNEYRARAKELANTAPAADSAPEHDRQRQLQTRDEPDDPHRQPDRDNDLGM